MVKYIVYWVIVSTVPCTPKQPKPDEFGVVSSSNIVLSALCVETVKEPKSKEFISRDSAFAFYERATFRAKSQVIKVFTPGYIPNYFTRNQPPDITDVRIDSLITN